VAFHDSRVFVTGATGLLGSQLVRLLIERGAKVVALVRDSVPRSLFYQDGLDKQVISVRGELEDFALLERTINEYSIDTIFHLAAQAIVPTANRGPLATFETNIGGTWKLLEAARLHQPQVKRIVIASSDKAYGALDVESYDETNALRGEHPYDVSKSCADLIARSYWKSFDLPVAITRCGNLFGPGDLNESRIIPGAIARALKGLPPIIRSDGTPIRDYLFAPDAAEAYLTLAEAMVGGAHGGEAFNFSYGLRLSAREVVDKVLVAVKRTDLVPIVLNQAPNEIAIQTLDSKKARAVLGWSPRIGFDEGLARTVAWYQGSSA